MYFSHSVQFRILKQIYQNFESPSSAEAFQALEDERSIETWVFFSCQTPCCLWSSHHTVTWWAETLQHLARGGGCFCSTSLQPCSSHASRWRGPSWRCPALPWSVLRGDAGDESTVGAVCMWGHHPCHQRGTSQGGAQRAGWSRPLPSCQCHSAPGCCRVRSGVWQGTGNRAGRGGKAVGEGEQKEIHWRKAEWGYGLVFIFNNGQLWIFTQDYFRSQARLFHASLVPEFPLQLSDSKWYYLQLLQESRSSGECPWWMAVISVLWLPKSYYSSAISGCLPTGRIPSRINCVSHLIVTPGSN